MTPKQKDVLTHLGAAVVFVHGAEQIIRFCLKHCFQITPLTDAEAFFEADKLLRRKTLGQFLSMLRTRVDLDDKFDAELAQFLDMRNTLIHNVTDIPGWDLLSDDGADTALLYVDGLIGRTQRITYVFAGVASSWAKEAGMSAPLPGHPFFGMIDEVYAPLARSLFFAKADD